jgi:acyl carrier protein
MDEHQIRDTLRRYVCAELMGEPSYRLGDDEPLITGGLIDSFCVAHLGVFIETTFGVYIPDADLTVENMDTIASIARRVRADERPHS